MVIVALFCQQGHPSQRESIYGFFFYITRIYGQLDTASSELQFIDGANTRCMSHGMETPSCQGKTGSFYSWLGARAWHHTVLYMTNGFFLFFLSFFVKLIIRCHIIRLNFVLR